MAHHDVNLTDDHALPYASRQTVILTDLGQAIVEYIIPKKRKRMKKGVRKGTARGRERERKHHLEIERALWQPNESLAKQTC